MSILYKPRPPPPAYKSIAQWLQAGMFTAYHGTAELTYITAWRLIRTARHMTATTQATGDAKTSSRYAKYEWALIRAAEQARHCWGHAFLRTFNVTCTIHHTHPPLHIQSQPYVFAQLNQQSIIELATSAIASGNRTKCPHCQNGNFGTLPTQPHYQPFYLVNAEFALIPFFGWCRAVAGVIIRRGVKQSTKRGVETVIHRMRTYKDSFLLSVEGQRSPTGELSEYKRGAAIIAISSRADIVPVYAVGAGNVWPFGDWRIRPGHVTMAFGDVVSTAGVTLDDRSKLTDQLRQIAETEIPKLHASIQIQSSL